MRPLIENGFEVMCADCREIKRWEGSGRKAKVVCGCVVVVAEKPKGLSAKGRARKGKRLEQGLVNELIGMGLRAHRQPGSGAFGTQINEASMAGDVVLYVGGDRYRTECKARANGEGFKVLEGWIRDCDMLCLKRDRQAPMWVLPHAIFMGLVAKVEGSK